jgi:hypothetical protein
VGSFVNRAKIIRDAALRPKQRLHSQFEALRSAKGTNTEPDIPDTMTRRSLAEADAKHMATLRASLEKLDGEVSTFVAKARASLFPFDPKGALLRQEMRTHLRSITDERKRIVPWMKVLNFARRPRKRFRCSVA